MEYICIEDIVIHEAEQPYGELTGNTFTVKEGSYWVDDNHDSENRYSGFLSNGEGRWLNIDSEALKHHFKRLKE